MLSNTTKITSNPQVAALLSVLTANEHHLYFAGGTLTALGAAALYRIITHKKTAAQEITNTSSENGVIYADDVTRLNKTPIDRIFYVRTTEDVQQIVKLAKQMGKQISMRGQSHTMGGQTIAPDGYLIDMKYLNRLSYDPATQTATAQPGATWGQLIRLLNDYGMSPSIMQSYCSFSIGGTLAVNAHGITSDHPMYDSVLQMKIVTADGELLTCTPSNENKELFSLALGGYGLFGIITEVTLKVVPNVKITMDTLQLKVSDFQKYYEQFLADPTVEVKLGRIDITNFQNIFMFVFRRANSNRTISDLTDHEREMSIMSRLLYKWIIPLRVTQRFRFLLESLWYKPLDWNGENDRNLLMYESSVPLAKLYQPLIKVDDTFLLQEYFIPHEKFSDWMQYLEYAFTSMISLKHSSLLNITIRYVKQDKTTFLPYAKKDMFAFVFYYRTRRNEKGDEEIKQVHQRLIEVATEMGGTFFAPYRHHYTPEQLKRAYPEIQEFFRKKSEYDPEHLFSNLWFQHYSTEPLRSPVPTLPPPVVSLDNRSLQVVEEQRLDSYKKLFESVSLRKKFEKFLHHVFNIENPNALYFLVSRAAWNPNNRTDREVYIELERRLKGRRLQLYFKMRNMYKSLTQLKTQKQELTGELTRILSALGLSGSIHDYASIGDAGRMVVPLQQALGMKGNVYIIHDKRNGFMDNIEQGSRSFIGKFVPIDYNEAHKKLAIPSNSVDLVTCNMGLHHFKQDQLLGFVDEVRRILRPGGVFIFREHDGQPDVIPLLDIAHSVFNVVTGVNLEAERTEIRAFRPIEEWRNILTSSGFQDAHLFELEDHDPTEDIMLCFVKPPLQKSHTLLLDRYAAQSIPAESTPSQEEPPVASIAVEDYKKKIAKTSAVSTFYRLPEWYLVRVAQIYGEYLNHTPWYRFPYFKYTSLYWKLFAKEVKAAAAEHGYFKSIFSSGFVMDYVIGCVLSVSFGQLGLLAAPLKMAYGKENPVETEQVLVQCANPNILWNQIDARIQSQSLPVSSRNGQHLFMLTIPKHVPFTQILLNISRQSQKDAVSILEISGQKKNIHMEVIIRRDDTEGALSSILDVPSTKVVFQYEYPTLKEVHVGLVTAIPDLLNTMSALESIEGVSVQQIYDFL